MLCAEGSGPGHRQFGQAVVGLQPLHQQLDAGFFMAHMGIQAAQFRQGFTAAFQAQAGFEIFPGLAPQFVAQAQAAQCQQQFRIVRAVFQPLFGND